MQAIGKPSYATPRKKRQRKFRQFLDDADHQALDAGVAQEDLKATGAVHFTPPSTGRQEFDSSANPLSSKEAKYEAVAESIEDIKINEDEDS